MGVHGKAEASGKGVTLSGIDAEGIVEADEAGVKVDSAAAASGVERGGLPKFEQAAKSRVNSKGRARFIVLFVFYIHRVGIHYFVLTIHNIHVAGKFFHVFLNHSRRAKLDEKIRAQRGDCGIVQSVNTGDAHDQVNRRDYIYKRADGY